MPVQLHRRSRTVWVSHLCGSTRTLGKNTWAGAHKYLRRRLVRGGVRWNVLSIFLTNGNWRAARLSPNTLLRLVQKQTPNGQTLVWNRPPWIEPDTPQHFEVLFEDAHLLAVNKPGGLPTLPAAALWVKACQVAEQSSSMIFAADDRGIGIAPVEHVV